MCVCLVFFPLKKEQKKGESTAKEKKTDKREWEKEEKDTFIITLFFFSSG